MLILSGSITKGQDTIPSLKISFDQAWELTTQNSHVIKQIENLKLEKEACVKSAKALFLPKIGFTANYTLMSDDITFDLTPIKDVITPLYQYGTFTGVPNPDPLTNKIQPLLPDNLSTQAVRSSGLEAIQSGNWDPVIQKKLFGVMAATFQWPIYAGGKIVAANKVATIERNEIDEVSRQKEGEILCELVERYYGLCLANKAVIVRQQVLKDMEQHLSDAQKMQAQGLISQADVLQAEVYKAKASRELSKARRNVFIINQSLVNTLTLDRDTIIEPISELFYLDSIETLDMFKTMALERNPILLQVDHKRLLAQQNYNIEKAGYFPQIAVQGTYDIGNKNLSPYLPDWIVGVGLKWNIFEGTARYQNIKGAYFKSEQVEEIKLKAVSDITTMVTRFYNELIMYREQLLELESTRTFNEEYLRVRTKAFHEEMSNLTEVSDATLALAQVRIERLEAMYGYDISLARLLQYTGIPEQFQQYRQLKDVKTEN